MPRQLEPGTSSPATPSRRCQGQRSDTLHPANHDLVVATSTTTTLNQDRSGLHSGVRRLWRHIAFRRPGDGNRHSSRAARRITTAAIAGAREKRQTDLYLQFQTSGGNTFGKVVRGGDGLIGKKLIAGRPYTVYGQATTGSGGILHLIINLGPCSTTAAPGTDGGVIAGIGKLLKAQKLTNGPSSIIFEIYGGARVTQPC